ncbi:MAG: hypothetical protein L3J58_09220 [Emcibacter sp.]|nr:hypothetical protein [Emcibacter sp.]
MIEDKEVNAMANKIIEEHGNDAPDYVRHKINLLLEEKDTKKLDTWRRVHRVIM